MTTRSPQKLLRELLHSRSAAASAMRICAMVMLAQSAVFVARAPFASRGFNDLAVMEINADDTARYRNGSYVNGKALASLLAELVETLWKRAKLDDAQVKGPERLAHLKRVSDDQYWAMKRTLEKVLPEAVIVAPDAAPSERPESAPLPPPSRYLAELHKIVLFDQWLRADELTVWLSPLSDSSEDVRVGGAQNGLTSICVTHRGKPQLAAIASKDAVHWGIYGRGNDLQLRVTPPMWAFPERFGISVDSPEAGDLARRAFFDDLDLFAVSNMDKNLLAALASSVDAVLLEKPTELRTLCTGSLFLRLYGGKVTDLAGREVEFAPAGGSTQGTVFASLYYHQRMMQQVIDAKAGKNITRDYDVE